MLEQLNQQIQLFMEFTKANPVMAGIVSLWGLGVLTFLLRSVPTRIWRFLERQCTTSLKMNNTEVGTNQDVFNNFITWLNNSKWSKWSRSMSVDGKPSSWTREGYEPGGVTVGIGEGNHFFMKGWRPFWVMRRKVEGSQGTRNIFHEITITMLGRNRDILKSLYDEFNPPVVVTNLEIMVHAHDKGWTRLTQTQKRSIDSVITAHNVKEQLIAKIKWWKDNRQWYLDRGLPHKLVIALNGPPGTGKTSLIKGLASLFERKLCLFTLPGQNQKSLQSAFSSIPEDSIVLLEDFDSCRALQRRENVEDVRASDKRERRKEDGSVKDRKADTPRLVIEEMLTLSDILNAFDGVVALDSTIVFLTSNDLSNIDPAFMRPGRVDHQIYVGPLEHENIVEYVRLMFPAAIIPENTRFAPLVGCRVQELYFAHHEDAQAFIHALPKEVDLIAPQVVSELNRIAHSS
jgi:chaperone BCS1